MINELWVLLADMSNLTSSASTELYQVGKLVKFSGFVSYMLFLNLQTLKLKLGHFTENNLLCILVEFVRKCQYLTFKVNFLFQESSESF